MRWVEPSSRGGCLRDTRRLRRSRAGRDPAFHLDADPSYVRCIVRFCSAPCLLRQQEGGERANPLSVQPDHASLPPAAAHRAGAVYLYRYRVVAEDGTILRVMNCHIPATATAVELTHRGLDIPEEARRRWEEESAATLSGSAVADGCVSEGECQLEPITAIGDPGEEDPGCGATCYGGGPGEIMDPGGEDPTGGGTSPCTHCGPGSPTLTCTRPVTRGTTVTCTAAFSGTGPGVTGWSFSGRLGTITGPNGGNRWAGAPWRAGW